MARLDALSIELTTSGKDKLAEEYDLVDKAEGQRDHV